MPAFRIARRTLLAAGAAACLPLARAQSPAAYPTRPVRIIVGFPAGTGPDIVARLVARKLSESWGNMGVIVDNKPGAGGLIAATEAARAAPDGYTLMLGETGQLAIAPSSYNKLPYAPAQDFAPVSHLVGADFALLVNPQKVPARTLGQFVDWARQQKQLFMATFGAGTPGHFGAYMFGDAVKLRPEPVHYKTTSDALGGMYSGDVHAVFASVGLAAPQVKAGKLLALATTGPERSASLPDVPTMKEQGLPRLVVETWYGMFAPAGTPAAVVSKLNTDVNALLQQPDVREAFARQDLNAVGGTPERFGDMVSRELARWARVVAAAKIKAD